jgi:hypothetical protein
MVQAKPQKKTQVCHTRARAACGPTSHSASSRPVLASASGGPRGRGGARGPAHPEALWPLRHTLPGPVIHLLALVRLGWQRAWRRGGVWRARNAPLSNEPYRVCTEHPPGSAASPHRGMPVCAWSPPHAMNAGELSNVPDATSSPVNQKPPFDRVNYNVAMDFRLQTQPPVCAHHADARGSSSSHGVCFNHPNIQRATKSNAQSRYNKSGRLDAVFSVGPC